MKVKYILQGRNNYPSCTLIALMNACKYFHLPAPKIGSDEWERLVDVAGCRYGSAVAKDDAANELGLKLKRIRVGPRTVAKNLPVLLTALNPHWGTYMHAVLVVESNRDTFKLVNFRWKTGPITETFKWANIPMIPSGNINRKAWTVQRG